MKSNNLSLLLSFILVGLFLSACYERSPITGNFAVKANDKFNHAYSGDELPVDQLVVLESVDRYIVVNSVDDKSSIWEGGLGHRVYVKPGNRKVGLKYFANNSYTNPAYMNFNAELGSTYRANFKMINGKFIPWIEKLSADESSTIVSSNVVELDKKFETSTGVSNYFSTLLKNRDTE